MTPAPKGAHSWWVAAVRMTAGLRTDLKVLLDPPAGRSLRPGVQLFALVVLAVLVVGVVAQQPIDIGPADYWVHAGSVEIFSRDLTNPRHTYGVDPAHGGGATSNTGLRGRHFSPWQLLLASIKRLASLSISRTMLVGAVLSSLTLVSGLAFFGLQLKRVTGLRWLPISMPVAVLFLLGTGTSWSGSVYWTLLPLVAVYPSTVAVGLSFWGAGLLIELLRRPNPAGAIALLFLSIAILLVHQLQYAFFMLWCGLWLVFGMRDSAGVAIRVKLLLLLGMALPLSLLWPYFSWSGVTTTAVTQVGPEVFRGPARFYAPTETLIRFGVALGGVPLAFLTPPAVRAPLIAFIAMCTLMWQTGVTASLPTAGHRWATPALLGMQISLAFALSWCLEVAFGTRRWSRPVVAAVVALAVVFALSLALQLRQFHSQYSDVFPLSTEFARARDLHRWARFAAGVPLQWREATILADNRASFAMTGSGLNPVLFSSRFRESETTPTASALNRIYAEESAQEDRCNSLLSLAPQVFVIDTVRQEAAVQEELSRLGSLVYERDGIQLRRKHRTLNCSELRRTAGSGSGGR